MHFHVIWGLGSSGGLRPILWPMKLSFSSCEVGSCCLQSQVAEARLTPLWCAWGTPGDLLYSCKWRGTLPPFSRGTGCGFPHLEEKLADLPADCFIHGTKHEAWCWVPLIWGAPPRQVHYATVFNYTAARFFPHSVPRVVVKRSIKVAWKTKSGFSSTSSDLFPTETSLVMKVGMYLQTFTQRLNILTEICMQ